MSDILQSGHIMRVFSAEQDIGVEESVDIIAHDGVTLALIIRASFSREGVNFFTPREYSQQLAHMEHAAGTKICAHVHNIMAREVKLTQEVLLIKRGRVRVDLYGANLHYVTSRTLGPGDVILLSAGGHGFEMLEDAAFIEVKQGPYMGDHDKVRFEPRS
ncbi:MULTISPECIES: hypothetical protein [Caballeronia]|jgi:mannose-6-phosphate isomerase-like protein (cupin superfamily)|uniref:hypothetical protein n=1 Tax=Caballeronia TaxID=1827195 RepID=UPI00158A529E|nr:MULTISPECIES: hypothetical protein [Caballeronia]MCG7403571.1 hypothetical protein [Caballeronia zhejiangensis]MCI1044801.1 hypothetical protein [Caballeronia zhejiangensis]MDR5766933.1 hypothetical protein [Caballeronia sp. LZ028]